MTARIPSTSILILACLLATPAVCRAQEMGPAEGPAKGAAKGAEKSPVPFPKMPGIVIGLGGGQGGKYGARRRGRKRLRGDHRISARAIDMALKWLHAHQDEDGKWDADGFAKHDKAGDKCTGAGDAGADVMVTGLALYAFLADGSTMRSGPYKDSVKMAVKWLRNGQRPSGAFTDETASDFVHAQAVATLAMSEAYWLSNYRTIKKNAQKGIECLETFRHPGGGWSSKPKSNGQSGPSDPSLTLWCTLAYMVAKDAQLKFGGTGLAKARPWLEKRIDKKTGNLKRVPVDRGPLGSSAMKVNPAMMERELTAATLFSQLAAGQNPLGYDGGKLAITALSKNPVVWKNDEMSHYGWFCQSHVLYQAGGEYWQTWAKAMDRALSKQQIQTGSARGSWNPDGVWGKTGGRVYSTAILALTLESYYHYTRLER